MVCDGTKSTLDKQRARGNQEQKAVGRCPPYDDNCGKFSQYPFRHVPNSLDWKRRRGKVGRWSSTPSSVFRTFDR